MIVFSDRWRPKHVQPAIKLLEFFRSMAYEDGTIRNLGDDGVAMEALAMTKFSTARAEVVSATMASMKPINETDADAWVWYWNREGIIPGPFNFNRQRIAALVLTESGQFRSLPGEV